MSSKGNKEKPPAVGAEKGGLRWNMNMKTVIIFYSAEIFYQNILDVT
jgi:hypothetical protein